MSAPGLAIVIPTWNGRELLERFLPSVMAEAERWAAAHGAGCEVVVSDDGSTDGTPAWLAQRWPAARCAAHAENRGFAGAANAGVAAARAPVVVLLNNDLEVAPGCLEFLPGWFEDPELFGVTLRSFDLPPAGQTPRFATGGKLGRFRRGFWETWRNYEAAPPEAAPAAAAVSGWATFMLVGGFCAFRRDGFLALGGFDPIFAPYYSEDLDLSYRARKRGWKLGYEPRAVVYHALSATVIRHRTQFRRAVITERNRLLFHWRNLDPPRLCRHLLWAHLLLPQMLLKGNFAYHAGFAQAVRRVAAVRRFRRDERIHWRRRDPELALEAPGKTSLLPAASLPL